MHFPPFQQEPRAKADMHQEAHTLQIHPHTVLSHPKHYRTSQLDLFSYFRGETKAVLHMNNAQQSISVQTMSFHCCIKARSGLRWSQSWLRRNRWLNFSLTARYFYIENTNCFKKKVSIAKSKEKSEGHKYLNFTVVALLWCRIFMVHTVSWETCLKKIFKSN